MSKGGVPCSYPPHWPRFLGLLPKIVAESIYFVYHAPQSRIFESSQLPCAVRSTRSGSGPSPLTFVEAIDLFYFKLGKSSSLFQQDIREPLYSPTGDERAPPFHKPSLTANKRAPSSLNGKKRKLFYYASTGSESGPLPPHFIKNLRELVCC